jgi:hypothetical protein
MFNFFSKTKKGQRGEDIPQDHTGLPDSNSPYGLCPRCSKQSSFDIIGSLPATFNSSFTISHTGQHDRTLIDQVTSMECRNCHQPVVVIEQEYVGNTPSIEKNTGGYVNYRGLFWWPFQGIVLNPEIPEAIQKIFREAKISFSAQCYRASAVMSRRTLEAIAVDKGENDGTLAIRIKNLIAKGVLDKNLGEWATEIRLIGNTGAHFDPIKDVEHVDAEQIILFIEELIKYLYVMPSEIAKRRNKS